MQKTNQATVNFVQDAQSAKVLMNPLRIDILKRLREPGSASSLARALDMPRQKLNYHLRKLEKRGFIEQVEERRKGNCVERMVRATAKSFIINPDTIGTLSTDPDKVKDKFSSTYLIAVASRMIKELVYLRTCAERAGKKLPTFILQAEVKFASPAEQHAFTEELARKVVELTSKYHSADAAQGRTFKFIIGSHPKITKKSE